MLESAPDAMVIFNRHGKIQLANVATDTLFGYAREEFIGRPVEMLMPERYHERHPEHHGKLFTELPSRTTAERLDLWGIRRDGGEFPLEITLSPLETEDGQLTTAAIRDVSDRRRFEHELREANLRMESASRAKDRFFSSVSHELRTPLNAILGFAGTLLMGLPGPLNDEQTKQLRTVQSGGRHLLSLINDLLDLARIESGEIELDLQWIDCSELIHEVAVGLRPLANEKGIGLEVRSPEKLMVTCDRRALKQILINLANNAIKFTAQGGVRLELSRRETSDGHVTRFSVLDTGCGIRAGDQERLFAAFEQAEGGTERPNEGTGLGLYICQTIAAVLGAAISFESEYGKGSLFALELPVMVSSRGGEPWRSTGLPA